MALFGLQAIWQGRGRRGRRKAQVRSVLENGLQPRSSLAKIKPGSQAKILSFSPGISPERKAHLLAYGLVPGRWVLISQHSPVTVIQIEHTELAIETDLAGEIVVDIT